MDPYPKNPARRRDIGAFPNETTDAGMTLRDYFAAKAMQALINSQGDELDRLADVPNYAYQIADAMLQARQL